MSWYRNMQFMISKGTIVLLSAVCGAALLGLAGLWLVEQELVARAGEGLALAATGIADKLDALLRERDGDIEILAAAPQVRSADAAQMTRHLRALQAAYPVYSRLAVTNRAGRVVASTDENLVGKDFHHVSWYQAVWQAPRVHAETVREPGEVAGPLRAVVFSAPISDTNGTFLGVVMTEVDRTTWTSLVEESINQFSVRTESFGIVRYRVLSHDGAVLLTFGQEGQSPLNLRDMGLPSAAKVATGRSGYVEEEHVIKKVPVVTGYARMNGIRSLESLKWGLLVRAERADVLASIHGRLVKVGLLGLVGFMVMLAALVWTNHRHQQEQMRTAGAERARADGEERLRAIVDHAADGIATIDDQGRILSFNPAAEKLFGYAASEVIGRKINLLMPEPYASEHDGYVAAYLRTGQAKIIGTGREVVGRRRDGSVFPLDLTVSEMRLESGRCFSGIIRDITARKQMVERLRESRTFFELLSEQLPVGVFEIGEDGKCLYKNKMWDTIMGHSNDEVFGFASAALPTGTWIEWVHPDDHPALTESWIASQAGFSRLHAECRLAPNDGPDRWVELQLWPMADDRGVRYLGTLEDITSRKEMTDRLRMSEAFFRLLSDHLPIGAFEIDNRGACVYGNKMWRSLLDLPEEVSNCRPVQSGSWLQWFHTDDREKVEEEWEQARTTFDLVAVECRLAEGGEEARWVNVLLWPMADDRGVRYLGTLEDITERKRVVAHTLTLLRHGQFELQTLAEAKNLAELLAYAFPDPSRTQLGLTELLVNGVEHGNLGISYAEKSALLDQGQFETELIRRSALPEHRKKRVHITVERTDRTLAMTIRDDGSGFDWKQYLDLNRERADESHGRGIGMAKALSFDQLDFQGCGNQVVVSVSLKGIDGPAWPEEERKVA